MNVAIALLLAISIAPPARQTRTVSYETCHCKRCQKLHAASPGTAHSGANPVASAEGSPGAQSSTGNTPDSGNASGPLSEPNESLAVPLQAMILRYNHRLKPTEAEGMTRWILHYSAESNVDAALVAAMIARESSFNPDAVSPTGAQGLGQLTPGAAKDVKVVDALDPEENVRGTAAYLARLLSMWKDRVDQKECAVASYIVGHRVVRKCNGVPPDEATRKLVDEVMLNYQALLEPATLDRGTR